MSNREYVNLKDTNVLIRQALKRAFPNQKFSVRGESYAGGASTTVRYVGGPTKREVEAVVQDFVGSSFDGMIDLKSYISQPAVLKDGTLGEVHYASDYVWVNRDESAEEIAAAQAVLAECGVVNDRGYDSYHCPEALEQWLWQRGVHNFYGSGNYPYWQTLVASALIEERTEA